MSAAVETDRLRKLDALFAEKVLGWNAWDRDTHAIPEYTRSLDAAWEGARKLGLVVHMAQGNYGYPTEASDWSGCAAHPAEALVLACLRAVGASEEELG